MDSGKICRACLASDRTDYVSMDDKKGHYGMKVTLLTKIKVPAGQMMCGTCCRRIDEAFKLREQILDANEYFRCHKFAEPKAANQQNPAAVAETMNPEVDSANSASTDSKDTVAEICFAEQPAKKRLRPKSSCRLSLKAREALEFTENEKTTACAKLPRASDGKFVSRRMSKSEEKKFSCLFCPMQLEGYEKVIAHMESVHQDEIGESKDKTPEDKIKRKPRQRAKRTVPPKEDEAIKPNSRKRKKTPLIKEAVEEIAPSPGRINLPKKSDQTEGSRDMTPKDDQRKPPQRAKRSVPLKEKEVSQSNSRKRKKTPVIEKVVKKVVQSKKSIKNEEEVEDHSSKTSKSTSPASSESSSSTTPTKTEAPEVGKNYEQAKMSSKKHILLKRATNRRMSSSSSSSNSTTSSSNTGSSESSVSTSSSSSTTTSSESSVESGNDLEPKVKQKELEPEDKAEKFSDDIPKKTSALPEDQKALRKTRTLLELMTDAELQEFFATHPTFLDE